MANKFKMAKIGNKWPTNSKWPKLAKIAEIDKNGRYWEEMNESGQKWPKLAKIGKNGQN